jgi:hypothetical protein
MSWYIFIHPAWQLVTLYLGIKNLAHGLNRAQTWTFSIRKHSERGFIFSTMIVIGALIGWQTNLVLRNRSHPIYLSGHRLITFIIIILVALIVISGLIKRKHWYRLRWLQFLHSWFGILAIGLMFAQLFIVIAKIIGW